MTDEQNPDHIDGCLCGLDHGEHGLTEDHELPAAKGGVQGDTRPKRRKPPKTAENSKGAA